MATQKKDGVALTHQNNALAAATQRVVRRRLLGPLLFGLVVGGAPIGLALAIRFDRIMDSPPNDKVTAVLLLFSTSVAAVGAALGRSHDWRVLFYRAFLTSIAMCVPFPLVVDLVLLWKSGTEVFYVANFPFHVALCVVWSVATTFAGGLFAVGIRSALNHRCFGR